MSLVLMLGIMLASWLVGARFKSRFKLYAATPLSSGLTGEEVADLLQLGDPGAELPDGSSIDLWYRSLYVLIPHRSMKPLTLDPSTYALLGFQMISGVFIVIS